jgi:CRP-like cAMP-binding protein
MTSDVLKKIPLFTHLTPKERRKVADEITETQYRKGQFIFREGDLAERFHILKAGAVKCVKCSAEGKQVTMRVLMPGDLFCCDAAAFNGSTHPGCAMPLGEVSVLSLSKKTYFEMLRRNPHAALEVIQYLGQRLSEAQEHAKVLALNPAEQRLATLFVNLAERAGSKDARGIRIGVRITRQDLANMAGIAVETATRIMSRFKRDGLVSGTSKSLLVRDLPKLKRLAADASAAVPR